MQVEWLRPDLDDCRSVPRQSPWNSTLSFKMTLNLYPIGPIAQRLLFIRRETNPPQPICESDLMEGKQLGPLWLLGGQSWLVSTSDVWSSSGNWHGLQPDRLTRFEKNRLLRKPDPVGFRLQMTEVRLGTGPHQSSHTSKSWIRRSSIICRNSKHFVKALAMTWLVSRICARNAVSSFVNERFVPCSQHVNFLRPAGEKLPRREKFLSETSAAGLTSTVLEPWKRFAVTVQTPKTWFSRKVLRQSGNQSPVSLSDRAGIDQWVTDLSPACPVQEICQPWWIRTSPRSNPNLLQMDAMGLPVWFNARTCTKRSPLFWSWSEVFGGGVSF